jgi:hypothetical protein
MFTSLTQCKSVIYRFIVVFRYTENNRPNYIVLKSYIKIVKPEGKATIRQP